MASKIVYPDGVVDILVPFGEKVAIRTVGEAIVFFSNFPNASPARFSENSRVNNTESVLGTFASDKKIRIEAGVEKVFYNIGVDPKVLQQEQILTRNTVANAATMDADDHQGLVIFQDASGGAVTCTTLTGTLLAPVFTDLAIGEGIPLYHASNHATNTSTLSGGTDVTLVGSGAVTITGGQYLLIKTAATTFDLVRVG